MVKKSEFLPHKKESKPVGGATGKHQKAVPLLKFPEYKISKVADLIPYARNSRIHSADQVAQICASIKEFGFTNPVLIDGDGGIIAGHGRVMAAQKLGIEEIPTITLDHLTKAQKRAYVIADNKLALNAGWDLEMLKIEISDLIDEGFNVDLIGFGGEELSDLFGAIEESEHEEPAGENELNGLEFKIMVSCRDEHEQAELIERLEGEGFECRVLML